MRLAVDLINFGRYDTTKNQAGDQVWAQICHLPQLLKKKKAAGRRPYDEIRYDNVGHMTSFGPKLRCKKEAAIEKHMLFAKNAMLTFVLLLILKIVLMTFILNSNLSLKYLKMCLKVKLL